ncbi:uncharacterized protein BT62DRAFT_235335 [Guyanagaster necrorhizus]|uniref:DUF6534 domain-containing protein n=1 Tax=Guyanagaster necrorhizus TaxID=856835 RepID=A0A9P7VPB2_9AGAR|nr:uncharacterized protein BT62DRAFT_235335 [Guyanagaster necrorhizus MCA 3950]KAG7444302.1 hypothetical protein BT62DRAFT_235335 [Guyanagaster necrorhizus MCA 3950]
MSAEVSHGPMLIGHFFNILLMGVVLAQSYIYLVTYQKRDKLWMKLFVVFLLLINVINTALQFAYMYTSLILHFSDVDYLLNITILFAVSAALTGIVSGSVQLFFAWRVKILTSNIWLVALVVVTAVAGTVGAIGSTAEAMRAGTFLKFQEIKSWVILWLVSACVADMLITVILVWHLRRHKTGFQASDELVDKIIRSTVQTGLITSVCAIVDLITYLLVSNSLHLLFNFPLSKLYTNTLMSSLNSRGGWAYDSSANNHSHSHTTGGIVSTSGGTASRTKKSDTAVLRFGANTRPEVFVSVEQHEMGDIQRIESEDIKVANDNVSTTSREPWESETKNAGSNV